jgi:hypothetical protein
MSQTPERLSQLFKLPAQLRIAQDFLRQKLRDNPACAPDQDLAAFPPVDQDAHGLASWCLERLTSEQIRQLQKVLRLAANQQRVYKRTVMLSPRAHLLVKALAEQEGLKMSDVIELYLYGALRDRFGMALRTTIDEHTGEVAHEVVRVSGDS